MEVKADDGDWAFFDDTEGDRQVISSSPVKAVALSQPATVRVTLFSDTATSVGRMSTKVG